MIEGSKVRVYPHGSPDKYAVGEVELLAREGRSIAVLFDCAPPFAVYRGRELASPEGQIPFFAYRYEFGPWIEMLNMGHYEIEEVD